MIINGIQEVVYLLERIGEKSILVERAFKEHNCNWDRWSAAVLDVVGTDDISPVPPFEVHANSTLRGGEEWVFFEGLFWDIEDAQNFIWNDPSDYSMVIKNYAGNICWTPEGSYIEWINRITSSAEVRMHFNDGMVEPAKPELFKFNPEDIITDILNDAGEDKDDE